MGPRRYAESLDGDRLRERREELGMSLREVASACDVSFSYIAQLERGERKTLSPEVAFALLDTLRISTSRWAFYFRFHGLSQARFRVAA